MKISHCRLANAVIAWNVLQHFYPYFDVVDVDWEKVLSETLKDVFTVKTEIDYYKGLCRMVAKLENGHGGVVILLTVLTVKVHLKKFLNRNNGFH